jgi:hypothetical protein
VTAAKLPLIAVVGCHRSGTSATAGFLRALGVDFGPEDVLMGPAPDNPKGFVEHTRVVRVHDRLLAVHNGSWDYPPPAAALDYAARADAAPVVGRLRAAFAEFDPAKPWGVKDPRMCLFPMLWRKVAHSLGRQLMCVAVRRQPEAVVRSLVRRNGFAPRRVERLVATYEAGLCAWEKLPGIIVVRVQFEVLLAHPRGRGARLCCELGLEATPQQAIAAIRWLDPELVHHG